MTPRTQRTLQALILAGLGLFLLQKVWSGTLYWYINDRFFVLVLGAAIGFLILARTVLPAWRSSAAPVTVHFHTDGDGHVHEHEHDHAHRASVWRLWIVALPLILGLLVPARPLGSSALANKGLNTSAPIAAAGGVSASQISQAPAERTVLDWVRAFNYADDTAVYTGEPADVIGFVHHDKTLGPDEFMVSRFTVTCCAADATGIGLRVQWPNAAALDGNAWVRVRGPVQTGDYYGQPIPLIIAESVEGIAPPDHPYLYP